MSQHLISLLQQCRSSVKTDLTHYERLAMTIRVDRPAATAKIAAVEAEADRLLALLETIDALREGSEPKATTEGRGAEPEEPGHAVARPEETERQASAPQVVPANVLKIAQTFAANDYGGPRHWAAEVFDWVVSQASAPSVQVVEALDDLIEAAEWLCGGRDEDNISDDVCRALDKARAASAKANAALPAAQQPAVESAPTTFQQRVRAWTVECFGEQASDDVRERVHRFTEEALELGQAAGCTEDEALQLVRYVYGRQVGEVKQEIGGTMTTLAALCNALRLDMMALGDAENARCWTITEKIRAKWLAKPKVGPLPGASPTAQPAATPAANVPELLAELQALAEMAHNHFAVPNSVWEVIAKATRNQP